MAPAAFLTPSGPRGSHRPEMLRVHCDAGFTAHDLNEHQDATVGRVVIPLTSQWLSKNQTMIQAFRAACRWLQVFTSATWNPKDRYEGDFEDWKPGWKSCTNVARP